MKSEVNSRVGNQEEAILCDDSASNSLRFFIASKEM